MRSLLDNNFEEGDFVPTPHVRADSVPLTAKIVEQGDFVTVMPLSAFKHEFDSTKCVGIPLSPVLTRSLYMAYQKPRESEQSVHVRALID